MPRSEGRENELLSAVAPFISNGPLEVFSDLPSFAARVRRPKESLSVALIWNPTKEELREIGAMKHFLEGVKVLLVLPDQEAETVALAHRILPAYISYLDEGIFEIVPVLKRLTGVRGDNGPLGTPKR
jgi:hypothetical protein